MDCGLHPKEIDFYSWYELHLLSEQVRHRREEHWDHTRHIMASMNGQKPSNIIKLPTIDGKMLVKAPTTAEQEEILNMWKHTLNSTP